MYIDFEDYRPDVPRVQSAISRREGFLLALVAHLCLVIVYLLMPAGWFAARTVVPVSPADQQPIRYVDMRPMKDLIAPPKRPAEQSDLDRRATTIEKAPTPAPGPLVRGPNPEKVVAPPPAERPAGPESTTPPAPAPNAPSEPTTSAPSLNAKVMPDNSSRPASGNLGQSLRNLQQYVRDQGYDNQRGGDADQSADIQFDSMGVDFGPWLRRFKAQVERNWLIPQAAMSLRGRVVIQFYVLRNGTIVDIQVVQPSTVGAFTTAAAGALKLSNPTAALPTEYPADRAFFTVTFHYNEGRDDRQ